MRPWLCIAFLCLTACVSEPGDDAILDDSEQALAAVAVAGTPADLASGEYQLLAPVLGRCLRADGVDPGGGIVLGTSCLWSRLTVVPAADGSRELRIHKLCIDVPGGVFESGKALQLWYCNGTASQRFWPEVAGDDIVLRTANAAFCVDVRNAGTQPGTPLQLWPCNQSGAQRFALTPSPRLISITSKLGGCVGIWNPQDPRTLVSCSENYGLLLVPSGTSGHTIREREGTRCLDTVDGSLVSGAGTRLAPCNGSASQRFYAQEGTDGYTTI
jgi:Ricin-type beta-trefoil lectin domain